MASNVVMSTVCLRQPRIRPAQAGVGGVFARAPFAADFDELVHGGNGVVAAVPEPIPRRGAAGMLIHGDLRRAQGNSRIGELA